MSAEHKGLAAGRWVQLSFAAKMANIGSEVGRALDWRSKNNGPYAQKAFERALELIDLTLGSDRTNTRLKEVARMREALVDHFLGTNQFMSTDAGWRNYFLPFQYAARRGT